MSNHQRAQRLLAQTMQVEHGKKMQPRLRVVVAETLSKTASFESMMTQPLFANSELIVSGRMGLEGMQQMQAQVQAVAVKAAAAAKPPYSVSTVYVTSPVSILRGEDEALRIVNDAVRQSLEPGEKVALSLMPVKLEETDEDKQFFIDSALDSVKRSLSYSAVNVCTSLEELRSCVTECAADGLSNEGFLSALSWVAEKLRKKTELSDWFDRYKRGTLGSMEFRTGQVKAKGFAYLIVSNPNNLNNPMPSDPSAALKTHCDEFLRFSTEIVKKIRQSPQVFANAKVNNKAFFNGYSIEIEVRHGEPDGVWFESPDPRESRITEVRALSKEEAVKLAKTIVECSDRIYAFIDTLYERGGDWDDFTFNLTGDNHEYWIQLFSKHIWSFPVEPIHAMHRWIQASLK